MSRDLTDYYKRVGYFRASGLSETRAHSLAEESMEATVNETTLQHIVAEALAAYAEEAGKAFKVRTYEDVGMMTNNKGLIVEVEGSRFQLTIVQV